MDDDGNTFLLLGGISVAKVLTFFLSCWLMTAVCCGLTIAIVAGMAYGYNYCMAEFITLTRSDIRVYMRRGQFNDKPDLIGNKRRMGDNIDGFPNNLNSDYQEEYINHDEPLSQKWSKSQDTRKYAEKLTKYSDDRRNIIDSAVQQETPNDYKFTATPSRRISILSNPIFSTTVWHSGSSQIIMRQFEPINDMRLDKEKFYDERRDEESLVSTVDEIERPTQSVSPDIRIIVEDGPKSNELKIRDWRPSLRPVIPEYISEVDEDAVVYKAV